MTGADFLALVRFELPRLKELAEKAMAQIPSDEALHVTLDPESNSVAILVQHLSGNMLSRWTDFLTSDGEKPDRHRDREFEADSKRSREDLVKAWERGWSRLFETVNALTPEDLEKTVRVRGEEHSVPQAIQRQIVHISYHVGQIVLLSKHLGSEKWTSLTIPRGQSEGIRGSYRKP
jgi:Protein of unknown function (DUF1572)